MSSEHLTDEVCIDYLTGEISLAETSSLEIHIHQCSECLRKVGEYRTILNSAVSAIASEGMHELVDSSLPWSIEAGEKRLCTAIQGEPALATAQVASENMLARPKAVRAPAQYFPSLPSFRLPLKIAASLILAIAIGFSTYRIGLKRGQEQSQTNRQSGTDDASALRVQIEDLARERVQIEARLRERETTISGLRGKLNEQKSQLEALEESLRVASVQAEEQARQISSERDEVARKLEEQQTVAAAAQNKIESLQQAQANDSLRVVSLENQIQELSRSSQAREGTIEEQRHMLAADRDIRDLMGARDLYIAEVYDVGGNGKKKKPYGRVFYTKGKSLVFYAYDLDQQPGLKNASTFQAWGLRGPDRNTALNLGAMYVDNSTNKRWVLRFDDPKALEEINAVFVTVEPSGGSRIPQGQQVLFAYLREEPNHP